MSLGFKINESQKNLVNRILGNIMKERKINKSDALVYAIEKYEDTKIDNKSGDFIPVLVRDVLTQIKDNGCGYIGYINDEFICRETMAKKRKPESLTGEPEHVLKNCLSCLQWKREREINKRETEMRKESIKKLQTFVNNFVRVSRSGFKYTAYLCLCNADTGNMQFSRGGDSLSCPLLLNNKGEPEYVNIPLTCMEKINPTTQNKPCEFLASLEGIQAIDPSIFKSLDDILTSETLIPYNKKEIDDIQNQNERLGVDADYTVLEDENYEGECPPENEEKNSCIMPLCEHATKCDSYYPKKKWDKVPLK